MLHKAYAGTFHHPARLLALKEHSHHTGMRQKLHDPVPDLFEIHAGQNLRTKARSIETIYLTDPALNGFLHVHGGIYCKVSSFGVPCNDKITGNLSSYLIQISGTQLLSGYRPGKAHIKIFLPAYQGFIGSPKHDNRGAIFQKNSQGRKLCLCHYTDNIGIKMHLHIRKPDTSQHSCKQGTIILFIPLVNKNLLLIHQGCHMAES